MRSADRLMYRLAYRNFGDHQTMVVNHTVERAHDHAGIRWYELRKTSGNWSIAQQGTFSPDGVNRFMGSAAMDRSGHRDRLLGRGAEHVPGHPLRGTTGERSCPGHSRRVSTSLVNGTGVQTQSISSHWGDYSMMSVDPSGRLHLLVRAGVLHADRQIGLAHAQSGPSSSRAAAPSGRRTNPLKSQVTKRSAGESRRFSFQ